MNKCTDGGDSKYFKGTCTPAGLAYLQFSDDKCSKPALAEDGKTPLAVTAEWDKCYTLGTKSFKVTGGMALKASAMALAAFVASQF